MEVHAHTHTARKKWTHYFWEFLMLFLAVFCGFLAENQREHLIERNRGKQFINSLVKDLEGDTTRLNELIYNRTIREARMDSLSFLLNSDSASGYTKDIYFFAVTIPRVTVFQFTPDDGTMQQLKNAGGLRLIRNQNVADSIIKYDVAVRALERLADQEQSIINIYREVTPGIFNGLELGKLSDSDNLPVRINYNPALVVGYKTSMNYFNNRLLSVINVNRGYRREARKLLQRAINLLRVIKKEYHLK